MISALSRSGRQPREEQGMLMSDTFEKRSIATAAAGRIIAVAEKQAAAMGIPASIAVVDEAGVAKAFIRMDGAPLMSVQVAQDKAYTAVGFGVATHDWHDILTGHEGLARGAAIGIDRLIVFGGGLPLVVAGVTVGGVGVSGGSPEQDLEIATAGAAAFNG
jgi:uncharacterized protein GlcG (DUF336 family)